MTGLVVVVVLLVAVGIPCRADDRPAPSPVSIARASDGAEKGEPAAEEKEALWLELKRGTRVRLMVEDAAPMREVVGRLLESDRTTVTVDTAEGTKRFSRDTLFHLQYRTGGRDRQKGAAIGASITGLAGFVAGVIIGAREAGMDCDDCSMGVLLLGGAGGLVGAIPGGAIGFAIGAPDSDWRNTSPDGLSVSGGATPRRATVALRLRFGRR